MGEKLLDQGSDFSWFSMATSLQLGEDQLSINADLETAAIGRNQGDRPNLRFEQAEQFSYQAHGPRCIASNSAIDDFDVHDYPSRR